MRARGEQLAASYFQLQVLNGNALQMDVFPDFKTKLGEAINKDAENKVQGLQPNKLDILQVNIGKLCNQSCAHCHVDAGPDRTEMMSRAHLERCIEIVKKYHIPTVDITGGAPEMHPDFRWFVAACVVVGAQVINRCNLTIIVSNPKYHDLSQFFAANNVHIISSLPFYTALRTDAQRGEGVFEDSVRALQMLNAVGYGQPDSALKLDLVYNPTGAFLPAPQSNLEPQFKKELLARYGIAFHNLFCITNMPISRYLDYLLESGNYQSYMERLVAAFNPATLSGLMCRNTISVSWDGGLYDCDFNQMLDLRVAAPASQHIDNFDIDVLQQRNIVLNQHCYGCTAGAGSSCGGEIA